MYLSIHLTDSCIQISSCVSEQTEGNWCNERYMGWCSANVKDGHFRLAEFNLSSLIFSIACIL